MTDMSPSATYLPPAPLGLPPAAPTRAVLTAMLGGALGMVFVGGSVAVAGELVGSPLFTAQAVRYAAACALLLVVAGATGRRLLWPRGAEWGWLLGVALAGLVAFNVALVEGSRHAEPAALGVAVACAPLLLAVAAPLMEGARPKTPVLLAALVVTCGAALVVGGGRSSYVGLLWALAVLGCEVGFTLFAVPVLGRLGSWGVSVHATWLAAVVFGVAGLTFEGPSAGPRLTGANWVAIAYLAVGVTAIAFVLWFASVRQLGAAIAGLLTGVAPVAAAVVGVALGGRAPGPSVWLGIAVVSGGLALGLGTSRRQ